MISLEVCVCTNVLSTLDFFYFFLIFLFISRRALGMTNCNSGNSWNAGKKESLVCDSYIQTLKMFILLGVMLEHDDIYWDG